MSEAELTAVYEEKYDELCRNLRQAFPRLSAADSEDLAQKAFDTGFDKVRRSGFDPEVGWWEWLNTIALPLADLTIAYEDKRDSLCRYLRWAFPRLNCAEDLAQKAYESGLEEVRRSGFTPDTNWGSWLRGVARHRALDYLRHLHEEVLVGGFSARGGESSRAGFQLSNGQMSPSQFLAEPERRDRQKKTLSQIIEQYCRECERRDALTHKEVFERTSRGQEPAEIAEAMNMKTNAVYQHRHRFHEELQDRIRKADPDGTLFMTILDPKRQRPGLPGEIPPGVPRSTAEVLRLIIEELGAMCPSDRRLRAFAGDPEAEGFSDVRYHVREAGCRLCRADLEQLRSEG